MLIEPASKVSVPLDVVQRTMFNVPDKAIDPLVVTKAVVFVKDKTPDATHVFPVSKLKTIVPAIAVAAEPFEFISKPAEFAK
jgi:hypothetical protein